jgi:2-iminobutanoate/2-iminopropanoate deaminase
VLAASKMSFKHVVKCSIFMSSIEYYDQINEIYSRYFKDNSPAREAVAVESLPKNVNLEISLVAYNDI